MIHPKHLRYGNIVLFDGHIPGIVTSISSGIIGGYSFFNEDVNLSNPFQNLEPIPLTSDWLKKFDFNISGYGGQGNVFEDAHLPENNQRPNKDGLYLFKNGQDNPGQYWHVGLSKGDHKSWAKIKYLHDLQNLHLSLKNESLELKSTP